MYADSFSEFLTSKHTLRIYEGDNLIFSSIKDRLLPLLDYIQSTVNHQPHVVIFDKIMGNAAALLSVKANCSEVYSPLGSQLAVRTLESYGIEHRLLEVVPYIQQPSGDMCPMEKLSIGKEPQEFYEAMRNIIEKQRIEVPNRKEESWTR